jgi:hypothetical protein
VNFESVSAVRFLDVEGTHEGVPAFGIDVGLLEVADTFVVLASGIPCFGDNGVPGVEAENRFLISGEDARVMVGIDGVCLGAEENA